jgi:hypothetical protein
MTTAPNPAPLLVDQLAALVEELPDDDNRPRRSPGVDDRGRDLLGRLLDDPDPRLRQACERAIIRLPSNTAYSDW